MLLELLDGLLGSLSVELDCVQVTGGSNGPQNRVRQRAAACTWKTDTKSAVITSPPLGISGLSLVVSGRIPIIQV